MSGDQILQVVGLGTVVLYAAVMFLARAHLIAWNSIHSLEGRIRTVGADVAALGVADPVRAAVSDLLDEVKDRAKKAARWTSRLATSGGEENELWEMVHHAEEMLIACWGPDAVHARLLRARADLATDDSKSANAWRAVIDRHLLADGNPKEPWSTPAAREDVRQLVEHLHRKQDESFRTLADVSNKTQWLVVAGLVFIGAVVLLAPDVVPLLGIGAVGGLANRIRLIAGARTIPTDYGAFWAPLFLAPVLGALLGWTGIYLVQLAAQLALFTEGVNTQLTNIATNAPGTYALALLFGFVEGAFNGVATLVDNALKAAPAAGAGQGESAAA